MNVTLQGINGEDWAFLAWDKNNLGRPDSCFFDSCIYVCKAERDALGILYTPDCKRGFMRKVDFDKIEVKNPIISKIQQGGAGQTLTTIVYRENNINFINLPNKLIQIQIEKKIENNKKILIVSHFSEEYLANKDKIK